MSESPFAFQDEPESVGVLDEQAPDSKRNLLALLVLALLVVGAGAYFLLGTSDETSEETAFVPVTRAPRVEAPVAPPAPVIPEQGETQLGENPFKALIVEPVAAPAPDPSPVPAPPVAAPPVIVVTTGTDSAGTPTTTVSTSPAPAPAPEVSTVTFTAVSGSEPVGTFVVDGKTYTAAKDEDFAGKVRVKDLRKNLEGTWVALLQVGDGTPFDIYENQEVVIP